MYPADITTDLSRFKILIADDQRDIADTLDKMIMHLWGCSVKCVYDGDSVLNELLVGHNGNPYDILITDMVMPGVSGLELIKKSIELQPDLAVLVITAYKDEFSFVDVVKAGAHDIILKPFSKDELQAKLFRILREIDYVKLLQLAEKRYKGLFGLFTDGIVILHPKNEKIREINPTFTQILDYTFEEVKGKCLVDFIAESERERYRIWFNELFSKGCGRLVDIQFIHKNGNTRHCDLAGIHIKSDLEESIFLTIKDVTEQKRLEDDLIEMAQKDELTGLYNKRSFDIQINLAIKSASEKYINCALLMMDIDNFKQCNDTYGHTTGDKLLANVGRIIQKCIRSHDIGFRFGGDEFAIILFGTDASISQKVAERIKNQFDNIENYNTSLSIGIAQYRLGMDAQEFVNLADQALYTAKRKGKNAIICINPQDKVELLEDVLK